MEKLRFSSTSTYHFGIYFQQWKTYGKQWSRVTPSMLYADPHYTETGTQRNETSPVSDALDPSAKSAKE